ncbi:cilia- and flagella-associated protein 69-like [Ceratina calcarata]|uniref:Cilia- and flagella-associated protein 69-like n=1 Tax=Ceratina calcarata TaxID=156304 RepID=A0AAJ7SAA9_9HYME|nr:cilia- and flagella-associated protein 69-like [Ceratina calcarata]
MILISFPKWNLVSCGIAEAVIEYLIGVETGVARVFSETIKFGRTINDLQFEKILLLIVTHLAEVDACIFLMINRNLMHAILDIVNPNIVNTEIAWNAAQFWDLWTYAINALAVLAPKMPQQFIENDGCTRLYLLLEWCLTNKFDEKIVMTCTKAICTIVLSENASLLECFREYGIILLLIKLITAVLNCDKITMKLQRILTLTLISAERLMRKQEFYHEIYAEYSVLFVMELLFRCVYKKNEEFQIDQRLLIAIGAYIWECIIWCPRSLKKFVHYGGLYIVLDIIEIIPYYSRCLYLGILTDMCDNFHCSPFLSTWRGINERRLLSLLAMIWREEEIRIKVLRNVDDTELLQMSRQQWVDTYHVKLDTGISPALTDIVGSVRSKIYSIFKLIERDRERYEMAKERYKILYSNLSTEDRITISMIHLYFTLKLGQMWVEVAKYFEQVGITPLGMDGQALFLMIQRYNLWASLTKEKEAKIIQSVKLEEDINEKDEYARIRDSKLLLALDAFDELDYIYRTTDRSYLLRKKYEQVQQVNSSLNFPHNTCDTHCHRTFPDNVTFTAIFNQHQTVTNDLRSESHIGQLKGIVAPISPADSNIIPSSIHSELSLGSVTETCLPHIERFDEKEL